MPSRLEPDFRFSLQRTLTLIPVPLTIYGSIHDPLRFKILYRVLTAPLDADILARTPYKLPLTITASTCPPDHGPPVY